MAEYDFGDLTRADLDALIDHKNAELARHQATFQTIDQARKEEGAARHKAFQRILDGATAEQAIAEYQRDLEALRRRLTGGA